MSQPIKIFISYAHEDESYKDELNKNLRPYERQNVVEIWDDRDILPGEDWHNEISDALNQADIALFLISPDFMSSSYIDSVELKAAMQLHDERSLILIPLVVRPSNLKMSVLKRFQAIPKGAKAISSWGNKDEAWLNAIQQLDRLFESINSGDRLKKKTSTSQISSGSNNQNTSKNAPSDLGAIQGYIGQAKLRKAIDGMLNISSGKFPDLHNQIIMQSSRLSQLEQSERSGLIGFPQANMTRAQITNALLSILGDLREEMA